MKLANVDATKMIVQFFPELGHSSKGAFAELSDPNPSELPKLFFERVISLDAEITIKEVSISSHYWTPSQPRNGRTRKGEEKPNRTRVMQAIGKIAEPENSFVHFVESFSPLGSGAEFTSISVQISENGTNNEEVEFYCSDIQTCDYPGILQRATLNLMIPSVKFDHILSDLESERFMMVIKADFSECAGCVAARSWAPGGGVKLKFLSNHRDVHNHAELPIDFFGKKQLGSGAHLEISFLSSAKKYTKLKGNNRAPKAEPLALKAGPNETNSTPPEVLSILEDIAQTLKVSAQDNSTIVALVGAISILILLSFATYLFLTFLW